MALITFLILQCFYKKTTVDKVTGMSKEKYVGDVLEKGATRTSTFYVYNMEEGARIAQAAAMTFAVAKNIIRQNRNFCYGPDTKVYLKGMKFTFDQTVVDAFLRPPMCELAAIPLSPRKRVSVRGKVTRVYLKGMKFTFDQTVVDAFLRPPMCELAAIPSSPSLCVEKSLGSPKLLPQREGAGSRRSIFKTAVELQLYYSFGTHRCLLLDTEENLKCANDVDQKSLIGEKVRMKVVGNVVVEVSVLKE
ncbi:hypothetical protein CAPTEDRAFT_217093 [Capitella teleta]|uniref:Uncharacterized protein n=1 Tax=Capitella teleta TaxID=283909 RepID=R7TS28_CAPTE|nr:hypothetical protein CAPTEDRAFT_217093 [Capitella teleta]|eukprot:ELT96454.1 hypothetical protein CAPTEDRAFT_217093 [Capitella teleta]